MKEQSNVYNAFLLLLLKKKLLGRLCLVLIKNNSVFLAHTFFSFLHFFIPSSLPVRSAVPLSLNSSSGIMVSKYWAVNHRLGWSRTGLNRHEHIPCQPLIYIQYTLHPITFAQQLCSQSGLTTAEVGREGEGITHASSSALLIPQGHAAGLPRVDTPILHFSQERVLTITERRLQIVLARGVGQER